MHDKCLREIETRIVFTILPLKILKFWQDASLENCDTLEIFEIN